MREYLTIALVVAGLAMVLGTVATLSLHAAAIVLGVLLTYLGIVHSPEEESR